MKIEKPKQGESREDYVKRLAPELVAKGMTEEQANATLIAKFREHKDLASEYSEYKSGKADMPKLHVKGEVKSVGNELKMVLTKEVYDRDGEVIDVDGMDIGNFLKNPVLLDAHNMMGSVVETVLGKVNGLQKTIDENGVKQLVGVPEFAPSPNGQIAKSLVENGFARTVSVGFGVRDYDHEQRRIKASELYEVSLVSVPANTMATIGKGLKAEKLEDVADKLDAALKNRAEIKTKIKEYRRLFMDEQLFAMLGLEKTSDELLNIKRLYDTMMLRFKTETPQESPQEQKETPQAPTEQPKPVEAVSKEQLTELIDEVVKEVFSE